MQQEKMQENQKLNTFLLAQILRWIQPTEIE